MVGVHGRVQDDDGTGMRKHRGSWSHLLFPWVVNNHEQICTRRKPLTLDIPSLMAMSRPSNAISTAAVTISILERKGRLDTGSRQHLWDWTQHLLLLMATTFLYLQDFSVYFFPTHTLCACFDDEFLSLFHVSCCKHSMSHTCC